LRDYETVIIWSASIPEGDIEKEHDRVVDIVKSGAGTYNGSDKWSRRILAYPIKKQTEGIYHFVKWNGSTDIIGAIDKFLRIHDGCLRFITLRGDGADISEWDDTIEDEIVDEEDDDDEMEREDQ
jgi:small subunit ribosomal protein S6